MTIDQSKQYEIVNAYHEQTKHYPSRYARSLGYLDWKNQPDPFRSFEGAPHIQLPLINKDRGLPYSALYKSNEDAIASISIESVANLLELSMGLSAWKKYDTSEWTLRINPSSGNLHPTECYVILPNCSQQKSCVTHYNPYLHTLEELALLNKDQATWLNNSEGFGIILTSIFWREAWKYGERAFRYCQHDLGHALGALRYACNLNGWKITLMPQIAKKTLDRFLGFEQLTWADAEPESAAFLCWVGGKHHNSQEISQWFSSQQDINYTHQPNRLSFEHVDWAIIDRVHKACQTNGEVFLNTANDSNSSYHELASPFTAEAIIRRRRSAQHYDQKASRADLTPFLHALVKTLPSNSCPFDVFPYEAQIHLALFVHAVEGLKSGLYMLVRNPSHVESLKNLTHSSFDWLQIKEGVPFYLLKTGDFRAEAQAISCSQAIAGDGVYALGMLAHFDAVLREDPALYPRLFWETGLVGQVLYLEAEAQDLRATGIGCFFDDEMHSILGLKGSEWQSLYHFTVGKQVDDTRLESKPPYFHLER